MELIAQLQSHAERLAAGVTTGFHFLRPTWLAALPLLWLLTAWLAQRSAAAGAWGRHIDAPLLQVLQLAEPVAAEAQPAHDRRTPWRWLLLAWTLAVLALAGPAWQREPAVAYASPDSWVLVLDLSPSMASIDLAPDRTTRARYAIDDLLRAANGAKVALLVFSNEAYTVAPLTDDVATLRGLTGPLLPDILPTRGDQLAPALAMAQLLLERAAASGGQVVVLTDGFVDGVTKPTKDGRKDDSADDALSAAARLRERGSNLQVVAIGAAATAEPTGVPTDTPASAADTARGAAGVAGVAKVAAGVATSAASGVTTTTATATATAPDRALLQRLASAGGGRVFELGDIAALAADLRSRASRNTATVADAPATRWRDAGVWLLPLVLLFAALLSRRGWWA